MSAQRLWFQNVLEGLLVRALKPQLDSSVRAQLRDAGFDVEKLKKSYDETEVANALRIVGPLMGADLSFEAQQRELGRRAVIGYFDTLLGHALAKVLRVVGPARGINRLGSTMRTVTNYLQVKVISESKNDAVVEVWPMGPLQGFIVGIFDGAGSLSTAAASSGAELLESDGERARLRLFW